MGERNIFGYNGRILRANLSREEISIEEPPIEYYQRYLGGRGFIAATLLRELPAKIDPLGPMNKLVFALGPVTGLPIPGSGRNSVGSKSPLTGGFGESEAGGFWNAELKAAGFDEIIIEGKADHPVYLFINEGKVELRDARHLWGMDVAQAHHAIQEENQDQRIRTAIIGPGGERKIRFASISNDITHVAGRSGMGAVMGSKNLKAIAVRGERRPPAFDDKYVRELGTWMARNFKEVTSLWKYGTGMVMEAYNVAGNLPIRNFRDGCFTDVTKISAQTICELFGAEMYGCYSCPIRCKKRIKITGLCEVDPIYGGPEYETLAAFGSNCGISDPKAICKAHEICNRSGIDTISAGGVISFAMECFENGLISAGDTGGINLKFGNADAMLRILDFIILRHGIGELLSEGVARAAKQIGHGAEEFAMHVKGMEFPMHDPRLKQGLGLHYSVNPGGADHAGSVHDTELEKGAQFDDWQSIDSNESIPSTELSPRKARSVYQNGLWKQIPNYLGLCLLVPYKKKQIQDLVESITGFPMSYWRLMKTVERGITLAKIFNIREGFTKSDDVLPKRMATPQRGGNLMEIVHSAKLSEAQTMYYQMLGWDEEGVPTRGRLVELGIEWAAPYLDKAFRE